MSIILQTRDLTIGYRQGRDSALPILEHLNLELQVGEFACLLGPNGAGKSTLLRTLSRTQPALGGAIVLDGVALESLSARDLARRLSVVLTENVTPGLLTARELVELGRHPHTDWSGRLSEDDHALVAWALEATGSRSLADRQVTALSDGERQRVMIARALAQQPRLMLLDEPTAFLDVQRRVEITGLLRRLAHETGLAVLLSTHDLELALRTADTVWLVTDERKLSSGAPEDLALAGAFDTVFRSPDVRFDPDLGVFKLRQPAGPGAFVNGSGPAALWASRALERVGCSLVSRSDQAEIIITAHPNGSRWDVQRHGRTQVASTLSELAKSVERGA